MKRKILICLLMLGLGVGTATAQLGSGIVYDPTNYQNALLRYQQLQQHLLELQKSYAKITGQLNLALQMAQFVKNMPARYRAIFSQWRNVTSLNTFGNTVSWINGINTGVLPNINTGYHNSTTQLSQYSPYELSGMDPLELGRVQSQYASIQLADGANMNAMATIGAIRGTADNVQTQIGNLEQDSFSGDSAARRQAARQGAHQEIRLVRRGRLGRAGAETARTTHSAQASAAQLRTQLGWS